MRNHRLVVALAAVAIGVLAASAQALGTRSNILTFSKAVALPGVHLTAGAYTFETLDAGENVVRVWNRERVIFTGFTRKVDRPRGMDPNRAVVFGESARGEAPPITAWYPVGESRGHQFLYTR